MGRTSEEKQLRSLTPADRTYFATAEDATLSSAEDANRRPIRKCPTCGRELYRRNLVN